MICIKYGVAYVSLFEWHTCHKMRVVGFSY